MAHAFKNGDPQQEVDLYEMLFDGVTTEEEKKRRIALIGKMSGEGVNAALMAGFEWLKPWKQFEESLLFDFFWNGVPFAYGGDTSDSKVCIMVPIAGADEQVCFDDEGNFSNRFVISLLMCLAILVSAALAVMCTARCQPRWRHLLSLPAVLVIDATSALVIALPVVAQLVDLAWAPLAGYAVWRLFASKTRGVAMTLKQLVVPVGNVVPLATIFWMVDMLN